MRPELMLAVITIAGMCAGRSAAADRLSDRTDAYVKSVMNGLHIPGMSTAVVREGVVVHARGYGLASVEHDAPATPETVYLLASMTKQFTAAALMLLVEEHKVDLDAKISAYLPDTPEAWKAITVRQLLTHTAGLKDRFEGRTAAEWLLSFTTAAMYKSARECPLDFTPGTRFQYSDQGYFLLGMIIEKVSGKSYRAFLSERIFKPLGMNATSTIVQSEVVKRLASGYTIVAGKLYRNHRRTDYGLVSHFGVISTVMDLAKWDAALYGERVLKRGSIEQMWTPAALTNGDAARVGPWGYGFGWFLDDFFGHRIVQHGGSTGTCIWRLPDDKTTIIVLTNLEQLAGGDAVSIAKAIAQIYVPDTEWTTRKAVPDPDPALSKTLRAEIVAMAEGKPDPALYIPEFAGAIKTASQTSIEFYKSIGSMTAFEYLGSRPRGRERSLFYRARYKGANLYYTVILTGTGKIASLAGEVEDIP